MEENSLEYCIGAFVAILEKNQRTSVSASATGFVRWLLCNCPHQ